MRILALTSKHPRDRTAGGAERYLLAGTPLQPRWEMTYRSSSGGLPFQTPALLPFRLCYTVATVAADSNRVGALHHRARRLFGPDRYMEPPRHHARGEPNANPRRPTPDRHGLLETFRTRESYNSSAFSSLF